MYDAVIISLIIATFMALVWHYEQRILRLETQLDSALDELAKLKSLDHEPPFNQRTWLRPAPAGWDKIEGQVALDGSFTQAEIDAWN